MKIFKLKILLLFTSISLFSQREYKSEIFKQGLDNIDEFIEFLSDPNDANIRLAPTFPVLEEVDQAIKVFVNCVKLACIQQQIKKKS